MSEAKGTRDSMVESIAEQVRKRLQQGTSSSTKTLAHQAVEPLPDHSGFSFRRTGKSVPVGERAPVVVSPAEGNSWDEATRRQYAKMIDHTLLKPEASQAELEKLCKEARDYHFATVCVNAGYIGTAAALLAGSDVLPIAVVGFPLGATTSSAKAFEAKEAVRAGAREIDMVINIGQLKNRAYASVLEDIKAVVEASAPYPVKVILETSHLTREEKIAACVLSKAAGAAFVKTSTGFSGGGATVEDISLMRSLVGNEMGVKASGGVRTRADFLAMIAAGANRIGASASVAIIEGKTSTSKY